MKISRTGIDFIKKWEGVRLKAYRCGAGVLTIGYGHTSAAGAPQVKEGMTISQREAEDILGRDLVKYEAAVQKALRRAPNQNQFDACVSLCFNIGPGAFAGSSVVRLFNEGDARGAANAFRLWNKAGGKVVQGLVNRREDERALFLRPSAAQTATRASISSSPAADAPRPSPQASATAWWSNSMEHLTTTIMTPILRHGLTTAAGVLVTIGLLDPAMQAHFVTIASGVVLGLLGMGLSLRNAKKK